MIVGIDVHKKDHAAALLDERGGLLETLTSANRREGYQQLLRWLADHNAERVTVGVESPGAYGRCLVGAGLEVLHVPAWRTHRERRRKGPGKSDPGDAISIAEVVLRKRSELGPALEPELSRALGMLELQRRRLVRDRTQAIQRLRADWTQIDPVAEAQVIRCDRQRELRKLTRIRFGDSLAERTAARCIRELAREISELNKRISTLDAEIAELLAEHGNPLADLHGAGTNLAASVIAQAGDVRRFRSPGAFARFCGAAPIQCGSGQTAGRHPSTAAATVNSTQRSTGSRSFRPARHHPPAKAYLARRSPRARPLARPEERSSAISPTFFTGAC